MQYLLAICSLPDTAQQFEQKQEASIESSVVSKRHECEN